MKHLISIALAAVLTLAAFGSWAQSENLPNDTCRIRANIASQIVGQKSRGVPLDALKLSFATWVMTGMPGANPLMQAQIKEWYNTWTSEVFEKWFGDTFANYQDYAKAADTEFAACRENNNAAPVDPTAAPEVK